MARIRTVKPEFWGHHKTARVSRDARLLFLGLLNESDDEGRQLGSPKRIAGAVFPNDDDVTTKHIIRWLAELERAGMVHRYVADGVAYLLVDGFTEHQKVAHPTPSRLPAQPHEPLTKDSGASHEPLGPDLGRDLGRDLGKEQGSPPGGDDTQSPPNDSAFALVAGYVNDYRATHGDHDPSQAWRSLAGKAASRLLADGEDPNILAVCLGAIAKESKAPSVLGHVVADYHQASSA